MPTTMRPNRRIFAAGRTPAAATVNVAVPPRPVVHPPECCCPACVGLECLERTRYFSGQLLTEADLNNEQSYWLAKSRLHNRYLHGWGVVCGMQVVCSECDGWVTVKPGYAIDPCGNDIIVCADQPFNVVKAINECCTPKPASNCAPLRAAPPDTCKDAQQKWCITIEYQEQQSRMVAPLKQATPKSGRCSCGGIKGSCGCGCGCGCGGGSNGSSHGSSGKCTCSSTQTQTATAVPTGACEPTRINEGFRLCVIPLTPTEVTRGPLPGTAAYEIQQCAQVIQQLISQVPKLDPNDPNAIRDPQLAFAAVCNFVTTVRQYFAGIAMTRCDVLDKLSQLSVPPPPPNPTTAYIDQTLRPFLDNLGQLVFPALLDCICMAFIPPCPPDPCDDRLCLACVTVQGGKIIDICLFGCRHQLVTFHTLYYWLSIVGLDRVLAALKGGFELICCGERDIKGGLFATNIPQRATFTTAGITTPVMANQMMTAFLAQKLGASIINAVTPGAQTVDLRPLVGKNTADMNQALEFYKISPQSITWTSVEADPAWTSDPAAIEANRQFAPAAFSIKDNLTVFTKSGLVVGIDVTDPVAVLTNQVQQLQKQVSQLTGAGRGITPESGRGPGKKKQ
jgi:hypothetical protein